ncbi:MAG TPA: FAD-dependent oxidoreductase [Candidatus Saccharimonadales bacterium]|nr:FAD-dependent oxidoreductase [Candidatus Saccharimonadales bacterium]
MLLTLVEKFPLVDNIWIFRFKPEEPFVWIAGQYIRVELPHENPDEEGTKRWFTNSAAPYEGVMQISTRITGSTFKQALSQLELGHTLQLIESPEGDFVWQDSDLTKIFVAAGIGVTPYHSILKQRAHDGLPLNATLIYGLRTEDVPFKEEFDQWMAQDPNLKIKYVIGEPLTVSKLTELEPNLNESLVYVSGPEQMVEKLGEELKANGLPEAHFKHDGFPHYDEQSY